MNKESLKEYLSSRYQGWSSFLSNVIFPIFGEDDFEDGFETELLGSQPERRQLAEATGIRSIKQVGMMYVGVEPLQIFDVTVSDRVVMERNRVNIQRLIRAVMDQFSCAFMLFHYEDDIRWDWRFTYCRKSGNKEDTTDSKRYTFLLGPGQSCRTATENFMALYDKRDSLEIKDIEEAFNVEALSKEFFGKYKAQYEAFVNYMVDPANGMRQHFIDTDFDHTGMTADKIRDREEKPIRDYVKKLLGRIVFLHFLQKKGWLGVPAGKEWGEGDRDFMLKLFKNASERQKENFLDDILENLFAEGLDRNRSDRGDLYDTEVEGFRNCRIPYLNGGLFERDNLDKKPSHFPASYFENLLTMLSQYNFTIDENDPNDAEVGVDPEMLGRIFENLLEDNKDKGAFYTPKEIVQYMCRESLIAYLQTDQREEDKNCIRQFVTTHDAALLGDLKEDIDQKLCDVKICDPAIGSGAFPMGLLRELFFCRSAIEPNIVENAANIKRHIIQNNIYGVDIERGAVDIARLRFWLSLIVDEKSPEALPNLDFKIMQGNSLLEQYKGADLSTMTEKKVGAGQGVTIFDSMLDVYRKNLRDKLAEYYACPEHDKKAQLRKDIADIVKQELDEQGIRIDFEDMDLSANSQFFLWHTWFHDVFSRPSKEGFDIVIGNPPYVNVQLMSDADKGLYKKLYSVFIKRCDLFALFVELGLSHLATDKGIVTFIIPSVVHSNMSYTKLRDIILNNCWLKEVCYTGGDVFNAPTVDTTILICNKKDNPDITLKNAVDFSHPTVKTVPADYFSIFNNVISVVGTSDADKLFSKILNDQFEQLGKHYTVFQGIVTGNNPAFIFDNESESLAKGIERELLHPLCHGRDIEKYMVRSRDRRILYIDDGIDIEDYPKAKEWMMNFKDKLETRREVKRNVIKWYGLQWPRVKSELELKEKILVQNTRNEALKIRLSATLDDTGIYGTQGLNFIIPKNDESDLHYLLGILNSKLINHLFATKFLNLAIKAEYLKQIRIPMATPTQKETLASLVDTILAKREHNPKADTILEENEIDRLVYNLYGLSEDEIKIVEG